MNLLTSIILGLLMALWAVGISVAAADGMPPQCYDYNILDHWTRSEGWGDGVSCDDLDSSRPISADWKGGDKWYRLMGEAGIVIPEHNIGTGHCGTESPGYIVNFHPRNVGETFDHVKVCFRWNGNDCNWSKIINVTNCVTETEDKQFSQFYVYFLPTVEHCSLKYCGSYEM